MRGPNPVLCMKRTLGAGLQAPAALLPRADPLLAADAHAFTRPRSFSTQGPHWAGRRPPRPTLLPGQRPHAGPPSVGRSALPDSWSPRLYPHQGGLPPAHGGHTLEPRLHPSPPAQTAAWPQAPAPSHSFPCSNQGGLTTTLPTLPQTRLLPPDSRLCGPPAGPDPEPHQSCGRRSRLSWPFPSSGEGVL